jgi:large subunit ribosomal protein L16
MLSPKRVKYRKVQKGRSNGLAYRGGDVSYGQFGLQSTDPGRLTARQIEAGRVALTRYVKRGGKIWIRVYPHKPVTKKAAETRQGTGKGNVEFWVAVVKPGTVLYEIEGVSEEIAREAFRLASHKLPLGTRFIKREEHVG